jgi:hypothetical protein
MELEPMILVPGCLAIIAIAFILAAWNERYARRG